MAFELQNVNVDLMTGMANVTAIDKSEPVPDCNAPLASPPSFKAVSIQFPFDPPQNEMRERDQVVAAAKAVLQQLLRDI
jgi:hypothetical protein